MQNEVPRYAPEIRMYKKYSFHFRRLPNRSTRRYPSHNAQSFYLKKLEELDRSCSYSEFHLIRMKVSWLGNTRPDIQFETSQLAQVTQLLFDSDGAANIKQLNYIVRYALNNMAHIKFTSFIAAEYALSGTRTRHAAFANNRDNTSQIDWMAMLMYDTDAASFKS